MLDRCKTFRDCRYMHYSIFPKTFNSVYIPFTVIFIDLEVLKIRCVNYKHVFPNLVTNVLLQ